MSTWPVEYFASQLTTPTYNWVEVVSSLGYNSKKLFLRNILKQEHSFGVIPVFKKEDTLTFLLVQHGRKNSPAQQGGHWAFPKGHAEKGETPSETALRELQEETGTSAILDTEKTFEEHYIYTLEGERVSKTVTYYIGFVKSTDVLLQPEEIADFFWATYEQAQERMTFEEGKRMLREAYEYLRSVGD